MRSMPWKRNKASSTGAKVPAEVEQYYESSRKERVGIAWLLALATLLLTVLIAVILFFAGRWVFNKVFSNDDQAQTPAVVDESSDQAAQDAQSQNQQSQDQGSQGDAQSGSEGSNTPQTPAPTPTPTPTPAPSQPSQTPQTGGEEIPRTGPDGNE